MLNMETSQSYETVPICAFFAASVANNVAPPSTDVEWMEADISGSASMLARAS